MEIAPDVLGLLFIIAAGAGVVDAIAGGGGLITLPVLMMAGLTPAQAIATNKIQALSSVASSAHRFFRAGMISIPGIGSRILVALSGAAVGAAFVQAVDPGILNHVAPVVLLVVAVFFVAAPTLSLARRNVMSEAAFSASIVPVISFYDGLFGPGTGALYAAAFVACLGRQLSRATAETKVLNSAGSLIAAAVFVPGGAIVWPVALVMAIGAVIGGQIGASIAIKVGPPLIRVCLVAVSILLALRMLLH